MGEDPLEKDYKKPVVVKVKAPEMNLLFPPKTSLPANAYVIKPEHKVKEQEIKYPLYHDI